MAEFRVALIDDHRLLRDAIAQVLAGDPVQPRLDVLQAPSLDKLRARLDKGLEIDLVMLDARLPELGGLPGVARFRAAFPAIPVILLLDDFDSVLDPGWIAAGAAGALRKSGSPEEIRRTVRTVLSGESHLPH